MIGKFSMKFNESGAASGYGFLAYSKRYVEKFFAISVDPHSPIIVQGIEDDARNSGSIVDLLALVAGIVGVTRQSQISYSIVRSVVIFVINLVGRPISVMMAPRDVVSVIVGRIWVRYLNLQIALGDGTGDGSRVSRIPFLRLGWLSPPTENAGIWIVIEKIADQLRAQWRSAFDRHVFSPLDWRKGYPCLPFMSTLAPKGI